MENYVSKKINDRLKKLTLFSSSPHTIFKSRDQSKIAQNLTVGISFGILIVDLRATFQPKDKYYLKIMSQENGCDATAQASAALSHEIRCAGGRVTCFGGDHRLKSIFGILYRLFTRSY